MSDSLKRFLGHIDGIKNGTAYVSLELPSGEEYHATRQADDFGELEISEGDYFVCELGDGNRITFSPAPELTPEEQLQITEELDRVFGPPGLGSITA